MHAQPYAEARNPGVYWLHPERWDEWPEQALVGPAMSLYPDPDGTVGQSPTEDDPALSMIPVLVVHVVA